MRPAGGAGTASDTAAVDPHAEEGNVVACLQSLAARVKHLTVRNAVSTHVSAIMAIVSQERGAKSPQVFLAATEALAALCSEYPSEALRCIPAKHSSKADLETLFAAMHLQTKTEHDGQNGMPGPSKHANIRASLFCLSKMVTPQNSTQVCDLNLHQLVLALLSSVKVDANCDSVSAQVLSGLTIAETMARASDVALLFFGSTSSQRVFVTLAMSSALRSNTPVQLATIRLFTAVVRPRRDYPPSIGSSGAKQLASNLADAGGRDVLLLAVEEHHTFCDILPLAFKVLTRLNRHTITAWDLGKFAHADELLSKGNISSAGDPFLIQYAFPEEDVGRMKEEGLSYLDAGHAASLPDNPLPLPICAVRPLLWCEGAGVPAASSTAPGRTKESPFIPSSKHTVGGVLRKAAKRWKRRNDDGEGGTGLGDRNRRCVYDVYDVEGLPHEQLFDSAYVMVTGNEYGALEGGADEESGLESPLGACSEFDDEEGEQKQDDENVGKEEGEGEEKEEDGVEEEVDDKEQDGVEEEVDDNEDGDDNATGSETESEGEEKSYCDDLLADEPGSMQSHVSQCLLSTEVEGKNDGGGRRVGVGWASTRYTGHKGRRKEGHSGVAVTSSDKVSALAEGPEKGAYMPEQNGAEAVRIGGISSVERTAKGTGEQIPRKLRKNVTLLFDSRFEGGNLARVFKVGETEYDLLVMPDINTRAGYSGGHTQWYYFAVSNMRKGISYTFNIVNLLKDDSLYNRGMRPAMFSERDFADAKVGWQRVGHRIAYYPNHFETESGVPYHTLTFTVSFRYDCDICYFAHCYPYGYSDLSTFLKGLLRRPGAEDFLRMSTLCTSLAGNKVPMLTITNLKSSPEAVSTRRAIILTARVHPGETCASWAMEGLLDFVCGNTGRAKILRNIFVFKVVPMLNPDGVISGQYRCSLSGNDLNRQWVNPCSKLHPTVHATKALIKETASRREVVLYCDLHGHSRKCNMFMYGCPPRAASQAMMERVWPYMLSKAAKLFKYSDCTFKVEKSKEGSARVVVWKEVAVTHSYTLEMSLGGGNYGGKDASPTPLHYDVAHYLQMGQLLCYAMMDMFDPGKVKLNQVLSELSQIHPQVKREAGEREMLELAKAREQSMAAHSKKVNENREQSWKMPDAQPKDTSRALPSVAALKVVAGMPKAYKTEAGNTVKAKVSTGAKAAPKKKVKKVVKKAGYG